MPNKTKKFDDGFLFVCFGFSSHLRIFHSYGDISLLTFEWIGIMYSTSKTTVLIMVTIKQRRQKILNTYISNGLQSDLGFWPCDLKVERNHLLSIDNHRIKLWHKESNEIEQTTFSLQTINRWNKEMNLIFFSWSFKVNQKRMENCTNARSTLLQ